jgi:hypothetical protein
MAGAGSDLGVAPEAPARFGRARRHKGFRDFDGFVGRLRGLGPDRRLDRRSAARRGRRRAHLDKLELPNRGSVFDDVEGRGRPALAGGRRDLDRDRGCLPAGPYLVAAQWSSLTIEPAVPELPRDRSAEVLTGGAGGAGSMADPAPGRLGLGCPAMRTAPHRHVRMVAANGRAVADLSRWDQPSGSSGGSRSVSKGWVQRAR